MNTEHELKELSQYMTPMDLKANESLHLDDGSHHGLFFIEFGQHESSIVPITAQMLDNN